MIVIDASAFLDAADGKASVLERIAGEDLHAPHLIDIEVLSALRRLVVAERIDQGRAAAIRGILGRADMRRHPHTPLVEIIWSLRNRVSAYDAAYVALAMVLDAPVVTTDRRLAQLSDVPCAVEGF